jgi:hypothetical protein
VHLVEKVIRKSLHIIENDPINNEDGEPGNEIAGNTAGKVAEIEDSNEDELVHFEPEQAVGDKEIKQGCYSRKQ